MCLSKLFHMKCLVGFLRENHMIGIRAEHNQRLGSLTNIRMKTRRHNSLEEKQSFFILE